MYNETYKVIRVPVVLIANQLHGSVPMAASKVKTAPFRVCTGPSVIHADTGRSMGLKAVTGDGSLFVMTPGPNRIWQAS